MNEPPAPRPQESDADERSSGERHRPALEAFLLDRIDFDVCLELQRRLIPQVASRDDGQIVLLLCEHPTVITIGRGGAPAEIARESGLVRSGKAPVVWVNRGGGCLLHCVGQLAIYPLVPLAWHGLRPGDFLERLQTAVAETLDELHVATEHRGGQFGLWGRTGQLAALGAAVRHGVTYYGAYLNVSPPLGLFRLIEASGLHGDALRHGSASVSPSVRARGEFLAAGAPPSNSPMSSVLAERRGPVRMPTVRSILIRRIADAFRCDRYHLFTGHPLLRRAK